MGRSYSKERVEMLRAVPDFRHCSTKELAKIDALVDEIEADPGEVLARQGAVGQETFVVLEGHATVDIDGMQVATLGPGDLFGEMALLNRPRSRTATVTATDRMRLLVMSAHSFRALLEIDSVAKQIFGTVSQRQAVGATASAGPAAPGRH